MITEYEKEGNKLNVSFDGVEELMNYATKFRNPDCPKPLREAAQDHDECFTRRNEWNGRKTMEDIEKALLKPTPETAENLKTSEVLFDSDDWATEKPKRKLRRRLEDGDEIDIDRWREREPDMWEESKKVKGPRYGVRIGVNVATSAHVDKQGFKWRTSTVVAMLSIVEELHIPCEVMCYEQKTNYTYTLKLADGRTAYGCGLFLKFPVKRAEHLLDVDLLAYVLGDRSFFRVGILGGEVMAVKEVFGDNVEIQGGLGSPREYDSPASNEFILSRACLNESVARSEMTRFKDWLINFRKKANYGIDERDDARRGNDPFDWD